VLAIVAAMILVFALIGADFCALRLAKWNRGYDKQYLFHSHEAIYEPYRIGDGWAALMNDQFPPPIAYRHKHSGQMTFDRNELQYNASAVW